MKIRISPATGGRLAGKARILTRKIGNFSDEFSGTSDAFSGGLGLNPDSCDIQLYTTFEILKIDQDLKKWEPKWYENLIFIVVKSPERPGETEKNDPSHFGSHLLNFQRNSKISKLGDRWIS